ncbi:MAG: RnfH family protein [Betaproteobacteria bacterium]
MLAVTVVYAAPGVEAAVSLTLPDSATVADAVGASGLIEQWQLNRAAIAFAIYGQRVDPSVPLRDGDRIELTRPLLIDAKSARHARAARRKHPP